LFGIHYVSKYPEVFFSHTHTCHTVSHIRIGEPEICVVIYSYRENSSFLNS